MNPEQHRRHVPQALLLAAALISGTLAAVFSYLFLSLYWPYRDLFNEEGRYFDGQNVVVTHEQSGFLVVPALAFLAFALLFAVTWWVRRRSAWSIAGGPN